LGRRRLRFLLFNNCSNGVVVVLLLLLLFPLSDFDNLLLRRLFLGGLVGFSEM
jgi:hypothetical protein